MQLEYLREFNEFRRYLNVTRAASELGISQSNLSKHIKLIEADVGCPLIENIKGKIYLTPMGSEFLNRSQNIVELEADLIETVQSAEGTALPVLTVQLPSLKDISAQKYMETVRSFADAYPQFRIRFTRTSSRNIKNALAKGSLTLVLSYHCGKHETVEKQYAAEGFEALPLCSEPLVAWRERQAPDGRSTISVHELITMSIMTPLDISAPMRRAAIDLCGTYGFSPQFIAVDTQTQSEFLDAHMPNSVYLYPESFAQSEILRNRKNMAYQTFREDVAVGSYVVFSPLRCPKELRNAFAAHDR